MTKAFKNLNARAIFLDWYNNFLTTSRMAEHYGVSEEDLIAKIDQGRLVHEELVRQQRSQN